MAGNITFTMIKPGAISNEYIGPILKLINDNEFHIVAMKIFMANKKRRPKHLCRA